jgi:hypothetical protein
MSTFPTIAAVDRASRASPRRRRWTREPLVHFIAIGAFLFAIDHALVGRRDDPHVIVVPESVDHQARELFKSSRGREPDADELHALRRVWLDNEVLYREGLAMQVDKGDTAIRERVILKALSVVDSNVRLPPVDDATLRDYFARNRTKYDEPARRRGCAYSRDVHAAISSKAMAPDSLPRSRPRLRASGASIVRPMPGA